MLGSTLAFHYSTSKLKFVVNVFVELSGCKLHVTNASNVLKLFGFLLEQENEKLRKRVKDMSEV